MTAQLPRYDRLLNEKFTSFRAFMLKLDNPAGNEALKLCCLEAFFSFIFSFTTLTLIQSLHNGSTMPGMSPLKRFISGTLVFVSQVRHC